jgi:hypothetical protein
MVRGLRSAAIAFGVLGLCCVGGAAASESVSVPSPQLASVVLTTSDFAPGAQILVERSATLGGQPVLIRAFKPGAKLGGQPLSLAISVGWLEADAGAARSDFADLQRELQTKAGRLAIAKDWAIAFVKGGKLRVKSTVVSPAVSLGDGGSRLAVTVSTNLGTIRMAIGFVEVDKGFDVVVLAGRLDQKLAAGDIGRAVSTLRQHLRAAFTVVSTAPPAIAGTPQQGQTLSVDEGAWTGAPSGFAYVWSRCDATGSGCAPVVGATANTYVPGVEDSGMTIRVTVTGANAVSSQEATSAQSPPIG